MLVTALAIGFPLFRFLPQLYNWMTRRRLFYWYAQLKSLEASFDANSNDKQLAEKQAEIDRIEDAVSHIRFPLAFSDQVYNLRSHIEIVRRKIVSRTQTLGHACRVVTYTTDVDVSRVCIRSRWRRHPGP